jgi:hypothetical protein
MADHFHRLQQFQDWVLYGTIDPVPFTGMGTDADINERLNVLARAAQDYTASIKPIGDWICGCSELLHANEKSCWRCGCPRP